MKLKELFEKQGGLILVRRYWKSGALFTAIIEFLLLGKSRTALEILRLTTQLKSKQKLERKYKKRLIDFENTYNNNLSHVQSNKVWICWFQGMENAPSIVQKCFQSVKNNLIDQEVILITSKNMMDYVEFPQYIIEKWKSKIITDTHMTDLLRMELLIKYGGMWLDATVLCTEKREKIPNYYFDSDLFMYQNLKPGRDGHVHYISSWLICAKSNNKLLMAVRYLCYEYWKEYNEIIDYFLIHDFFSIVFDYYPDEWKKIIPRDNATPHVLLLRLFDQYDEQIWNTIKQQTPFHKLSYKFENSKYQIDNTYYTKIFT